jgi:hypothetical protein
MSIASLSLAPNSSASLEMSVASPSYKPSSCYEYESRAARLRTAIAAASVRLPIGKHGDQAGFISSNPGPGKDSHSGRLEVPLFHHPRLDQYFVVLALLGPRAQGHIRKANQVVTTRAVDGLHSHALANGCDEPRQIGGIRMFRQITF